MKDWEPILRIGHQILLPARFRPELALHFLIMDTGASVTFFLPRLPKNRQTARL